MFLVSSYRLTWCRELRLGQWTGTHAIRHSKRAKGPILVHLSWVVFCRSVPVLRHFLSVDQFTAFSPIDFRVVAAVYWETVGHININLLKVFKT